MVALALALFIKAFLVQAFYIPSGSMELTLQVNDRVLVNKVVYRFREIHRGEVVVFNGVNSFTPETAIPPPRNAFDAVRRKLTGMLGLGEPGEKDFIKRVIGVPGDVVACCTNNHVTVNGQEIDEPYTYYDDPSAGQATFEPVTVEPGKLFVMGDHRDRSADSRYNGLVPIDKVVGRAFVVIWPVRHAKPLRVPEVWAPARAAALYPTPGDLLAMSSVLGLTVPIPLLAIRRRRGLRQAQAGD